MEELLRSGATVILVSHSMEQIKKYCQRVLLLEHGKVLFDGNTQEGTDIFTKMIAAESQV